MKLHDRIDYLRDILIRWLNWLAITVAGIDYAGMLNSLPQIQQFIPPNLYQYALTTVAIANFISHNVIKVRSQ